MSTHASRFRDLDQQIVRLNKRVDDLAKAHRVYGDGNLVHFTSVESFAEMVTDGTGRSISFRLSDARFMNDPLEGKSLYSFLSFLNKGLTQSGAIRERLASGLGELTRFSRWIRTSSLRPRKGDDGIQFSTLKLTPEANAFVAAFTSRQDDLDLWRAYGRDGSGVCLAMRLKDAVDAVKATPGFAFYRVHYDEEEKADVWEYLLPIIRCINRKLCGGALPWRAMTRRRSEAYAAMSKIHHLYKDNHYRSEEEIRLLHFPANADVQSDVRRNRVYCASPDFFFCKPGGEVILGPRVAEKERWYASFSMALSKRCGDCAPLVRLSSVPYKGSG